MGIKRRHLLAAAGSLLLSGMARGAVLGDGSGRLASTPIGLQLFTVRRAMAENPAATLRRVAEIGYREVEFAGYPGLPPRELKTLLAETGLRAPGAIMSLDQFERDFDRDLETAVELGHRYLALAWVAPEDRTGVRFKQIAELLNRNGEKARRAGLQLAYHNHEFEFVSGAPLYEVLMRETDPALVKLELDLYWLAVAKRDPLDIVEQFPGRILCIHVKDMDANGRIADVGAGILDFHPLYAMRERAGIEHFFIEHDDPADPEATIRNGFKAFSKIVDGP